MSEYKGGLPNNNVCCGCEACNEICKSGAITMCENKNGFVYPKIDKTKCTNCKACEKVCPIINKDKIQIAEHNIKCFAGYLENNEELRKSASGGMAMAFAKTMLKNNGIVYGVSYTEDYRDAEYIECRTIADLYFIRGSKYIHSQKNGLYRKILKNLIDGKKVLAFALPCEIAAIKSFLGKDYDNLVTCELICHGPTSKRVQTEYVEKLEKHFHSNVNEFNVRYKKEVWSNPYLHAEFQNGKLHEKVMYKTDFGYAFAYCLREACYECNFKGNARVADITIGDFWGEIETKEYYNKNGVSAIMIHTDKGYKFLEEVKGVALFEENYDLIKKGNPRLEVSEPKTRKSIKFSENYSKHKLALACMLTRDIEDLKKLL